MFSPSDIFATIVRGCTFFQLLAAMCLMFACQRSQIFLLLFKDAEKAEKQSLKSVLIANFGILLLPFCLAIFYPDVGKLAGYLGSFCALGCIYVLPTITNLKASFLEIKHPVLAEALKQNKFEYKESSNPLVSPKLKLQSRFVA